MAKPGATGITRIIHATNYSMKGLSSAWRHEAAFRQELLLIVLLMPLAFFVGVHIPADHEHQFRFNVNTISGPM